MNRRFSVREIAMQAGVSDATVDRVLHGRAGVRAGTVDRVRHAVQELEGQRTQLALSGRRFMIDVVVDAPSRFHMAVRGALEAELPSLGPAVFRARFHLHERWSAGECVRELARIRMRGSHGVVLKAPDVPEVVAAVEALTARGIPVVTLATDLPTSTRAGYVGMDNRSAGATAAYLLSRWLGEGTAGIAVAVSNDFFRGEEEREMGFRATMRSLDPGRAVTYLPGSDGLDATAQDIFMDALAADPAVAAVYSIGGGNMGIAAAFAAAGRDLCAFVGHDVNADNVSLLRGGRLHAVLHHDLRRDLRRCARILMAEHGALPAQDRATPSTFSVVTPFNIPVEA